MTLKKQTVQPSKSSGIVAPNRYSQLLGSVREGIVVLDSGTGEILEVNPALTKILGYPQKEFLGKNWRELKSLKGFEASQKLLEGSLGKKALHVETLVLKAKNGQKVHVDFASQQIATGKKPRVQWTLCDITDFKQLQSLQNAGYRIVMAAETTHSLKDLYPKIHQIISSVMPAENFFIVLYDEVHQLLRFPYFMDKKDEPFLGEIEPGKGLTAYVLRTGKSLLCTQEVHDELERKGAVKLLGVPSAIWLGVPLIIEGKTIGAMVVQDYSDPKAYGKRDQEILEFVSSQVAVAISRKQGEDALRESEGRLQNAERVAHLGSWEMDIASGKSIWSDEFFRICGFDPQSFEPTVETLLTIIHPDDRAKASQALGQAIGGEGAYALEQCIVHPDGSDCWVESVGQVAPDDEGKPVKVIGTFLDITNRKQSQALQEAVYRIATATETTRSLNDLFPMIHEIISSVMPAENFYITLYDQERNMLQFPYFKDKLDEPFLGEVEPGKGLTAYVLRTGQSLLCTQTVHDELERQGAVILLGVPSAIWLGVPLIIEGKTIGAMVVQHYTDPNAYSIREQHMLEFVSTQVAIAITRKQTEDKLIQLSTHDILTGLFTRGFFEEEMNRLERGRCYPISILMADVDHMKETNDRDGHAAGDTLLKRFAQVLTAAFRAEDIVARIGGDEFSVLLPNTGSESARRALERVRSILAEHNAAFPGAGLQVSFGISTAEQCIPLTEVLRQADHNMYAEKKANNPVG